MTLQPLLPVQHGGAGSPLQTVGLGCRPGSQHASPAKELLVAVRHGDAGGAARAAAAACLTTPVILAAAALMLCATLGLAVYLLPQPPLPGMLAHVRPRGQQSPRQRTFIEELTQQEQQLISRAAGPPPPTLHRQHRGGAHSLDELALTADQQQQQADQQQQQQQPAEPQQQGGKARQGALPPSADGEPLFNIHTIAGVPQLFGKVAEDREQ